MADEKIYPLATPTQAGGQVPVATSGGGTATGTWGGTGQPIIVNGVPYWP